MCMRFLNCISLFSLLGFQITAIHALASPWSSLKHPKSNTALKRDRPFRRILPDSLPFSFKSSKEGLVHDSKDGTENEIATVQKKLTREFFTIAVPAFIQLAAEPLASLVDTAYLGRLGPEVLGGAGVAISAQYAVSKLYNDPLLRTSISLVAAQDGKSRRGTLAQEGDDKKDESHVIESVQNAKKDLSVAVSSALLLALSVGVIQLVIYASLSSSIIHGMGVNVESSMWYSAVSYLRMRAFGTPAATLWLVANGIFRGLGDTRTPLIYSIGFTVMNAILDPLFIFTFGFGASGAALGTLLAQYLALIPLVRALHKKVEIDLFGQSICAFLFRMNDAINSHRFQNRIMDGR